LRVSAIIVLFLLIGCVDKGVIAATERSITISAYESRASQQKAADEATRYCAARGLMARRAFETQTGDVIRATYDCIP